MTLENIEEKINYQVKAQGCIRFTGIIISYIVEIGCFAFIWCLIQFYNMTLHEIVFDVVRILIYIFAIQDQVNYLCQILLICMIGSEGKPQGCAVCLKTFVLKEVWEIFKFPTSTVYPVNEINKNENCKSNSANVNNENTANNSVIINENAENNSVIMNENSSVSSLEVKKDKND